MKSTAFAWLSLRTPLSFRLAQWSKDDELLIQACSCLSGNSQMCMQWTVLGIVAQPLSSWSSSGCTFSALPILGCSTSLLPETSKRVLYGLTLNLLQSQYHLSLGGYSFQRCGCWVHTVEGLTGWVSQVEAVIKEKSTEGPYSPWLIEGAGGRLWVRERVTFK